MISTGSRKAILALLKARNNALAQTMRSLVDEGVLNKEIDHASAVRLRQLVGFIEIQGLAGPISIDRLLNEWRMLRNAEAAELPASLIDAALIAVVGKRPSKQDWIRWLETNPRLVEIRPLVDMKLLKPALIGQWAKAHPLSAYESGALDLLLEAGVPVPRLVWKAVSPGSPRPVELMPADEVIAASYAADRAADATRWLIDVLISNEPFGAKVLRQLLREPRAVRQFASECALLGVSRRGSALKSLQSTVEQVGRQLIGISEQAAAESWASAPVAHSALAILATTSAGLRDSMSEAFASELVHAMDKGTRSALKDALLATEAGRPEPNQSVLMTVSAQGAYAAVQDYLAILGGGSGTGVSGSRAVEHAHLQARRRLVSDLVPLADNSLAGETAAAQLSVALHNLGARPIGFIGEQAEFDPVAHIVVDGTALPGEHVTIRKRGWLLSMRDSFAVVQPAEVIGTTI